MARLPSLSWHKASQQFLVRLSGRDRYLGRDRAVAQAAYDRLTAEWLARGRRAEPAPEPVQLASTGPTIATLVVQYLDHADRYYVKNGEPTDEAKSIRYALQPLVDLFGALPAAAFGPKALKGPVIDWLKARHLTRQGINGRLGRIRRFFKWAVSEELVPSSVLEGVRAVPGLKRGRTEVAEAAPVLPVSEADFRAALPFMPDPVRAMAELSWHSGMRPGEVVQMTAADVDQSGPTWVYTPRSHKTEHHGRARHIDFGPQAQAVLRPWLRLDGKPLFSPAEWEDKWNAERRANRRTPMTPSQSRRGRTPSRKRAPQATYTVASYCRAVTRACKKAGIDPWSPSRIRHAFGTRVRAQFGLESAQVALGHAKADVTQIYAERNADLSRRVAAEIG